MYGCGGESKKIPIAAKAEDNVFYIKDQTVYLSTNKTIDISEFEADKYDIERKKDLVLLNISVINNKDFTNSYVKIDVTANNLIGQKKEIRILEIVENSSISYAALTSVSNLETLNYDIKVTLNDGSSKNFKYTHQFYTE
tara:strand:+ start:786 stop:1205 length:420 start_codon:yes stop_codon:yes gene_type:complete